VSAIVEHPIFVPYHRGRLAAVVTTPVGEPRGLTLLLTGIGLPQVIGSELAARTALNLARSGLASVRFDYAGIGDSTGVVPEFSLAVTESAAEQALSVLETAQRIAGADRFAVAGSCIGSRVALQLARRPDCVGAVCIALPVFELGAWTRLRRRSAVWAPVAFVRRNRLLRRVALAPVKLVLAERRSQPRLQALSSALEHARVLFVYSSSPRDYYDERVRHRLEDLVATLSPAGRARFELRVLEAGPLTAFEALSPEAQNVIVDSVAGWLTASFEDGREAFDAS
jgi:pimeloyl-ACP methyl ester carboxylesterase